MPRQCVDTTKRSANRNNHYPLHPFANTTKQNETMRHHNCTTSCTTLRRESKCQKPHAKSNLCPYTMLVHAITNYIYARLRERCGSVKACFTPKLPTRNATPIAMGVVLHSCTQ